MPHINTGRSDHLNLRVDRRRHYNAVGGIPAELNCSLCTAAAVVTHATGNFTTTSDVAAEFPYRGTLHPDFQADPAYQHSNTFSGDTYKKSGPANISDINDSQIRGVISFCRDKINRGKSGILIVIESASQPLPNAKAEMRAMGSEYLFAVLVEGKGHWNFAHNPSQGLEFIDYQSDHADYAGAVHGPDPMLGIRPGTVFHDGSTRYVGFYVPGYEPHRLD